MGLEIERKFLIKTPPSDIQQFPHVDIIQWYFNDATTGKSIRIRKIGDEYKITRKKWYWLVREEVEMPITKEEFDQHRFQVEHHFLEKTRYTLPYNTVSIELDIYKNLQWLITAEVEFGSKRDAKNFLIPERFGEELTRMREASNTYIANYGLADELIALMHA